MTDVFEVLASPARRLVLDELAAGEHTAGELTAVVGAAHGLTQPAVSRHLAVLRDAGLVTVRPVGTTRVYALVPDGLRETHAWLSRYEQFWSRHLDALETELARGARADRAGRSGGADGSDRSDRSARTAPSRGADAGRARPRPA